MKKIPLLILLAFCFTSLLGGIFCATPAYRSHTNLAQAEAASTSGTFSSGNDFQGYVQTYSAQNVNDDLKLASPDGESTVIDMQDVTLSYTIGNEDNPFCGTFDGQGLTIKNLTIDLSSAPSSSTVYAGLFGKLGSGAKIFDVTFENVTIIAPDAGTIYAGIIAYGDDCEISNVEILRTGDFGCSVKVGVANQAYAGGVVGFLENSKIEGVQIAKDINFELSRAQNTYAGALVGKAENSDISNIKISSSNSSTAIKIKGSETENNSAFASNLSFGGVAGSVNNCSLINVICRTSFGKWLFSHNGRIHSIGGIVGEMKTSSIVFGIFVSNFDVEIDQTFEGKINLGGVVGKVLGVGNELVNIGMKNNFNFVGAEGSICLGEIVGVVKEVSQDFSSVHYKENAGVALFGDTNFNFADEASNHISSSGQLDLENLVKVGDSCTYFSQQIWDGEWDFDNVWIVLGTNIGLQNFDSELTVSMTPSSTSAGGVSALNLEGINGTTATTIEKARYGQQIRLKYSFNKQNGVSLDKYYELLSLNLYGKKVGDFSNSDRKFELLYADGYDVEMVDDADKVSFEVVIKKLTKATAGNYTVEVKQKEFSITVTTKLYEGDDLNPNVVAPGLVQVDDSSWMDTFSKENYLKYGEDAHEIKTSAKPANAEGEIYAPKKEWWLIKNDGEVIKISDEDVLTIKFGEGGFCDDLNIFAKYTSNSCTGVFTMHEGVQKVELSSGTIVMENPGDETPISRPISKDDPKLSMDIFILKGYEFDVESFIDKLTTASKAFCKFLEEEELDDATCYHFEIDMTTMNWADYADRLTVSVNPTKIETKDDTWIWWVVGGVGGAIVLALIIVLIVWLVRRNRFGGGGKMKVSKKSYKGMYY